MERLWAPWRMDYILETKQDGCFLCEAYAADPVKDREHLVLKRGQTGALIMNRYPYNNGHLMAAPYRHIAEFDALTPAESSELMDLAREAAAVLKLLVQAQGFNLGMNIGAAAGAGLKEHLHLHLVPRWAGDTNFMPVTAGTKVIPQSLMDLYDQLAQAFRPPAP